MRPPLSPDPNRNFGKLNKADLMPQFQLGMHQTLGPRDHAGLLTPGVKKKKTFTGRRNLNISNNLVLERITDAQDEEQRGVTP